MPENQVFGRAGGGYATSQTRKPLQKKFNG